MIEDILEEHGSQSGPSGQVALNERSVLASALPSDSELLAEYAARQSEGTFARLVERHANFVYAAAMRQVRNHAIAQDVSQAVFIVLAKKAGSLRREAVLSGWLFRAVRYAAM